ncbi:MAG: ATP-binding protein [Bdellovibrio sp.]|nr:ATP-binding protein [Bdellovibrio sp.]
MLCASTAGEHHLLLLGPKGVGKSHAIEWLSVLHEAPLPKDKLNQILLAELNLSSKNKDIYSAIRKISVHVRPAALIGSTSGTILRVGEFSLAHGGLLIADEILEWHRDSREALREPLEQGVVTLTRKQGTIELPARFTLVASGNLCPCGGWPKSIPLPYTSTTLKSMKIKLCHCPTHHMERYFKKLSGPILDRIDIVLKVTGTLGEFNVLPAGKINQLKDKINKVKSRLINQYGAPPGQLKPYELEKFFEKNPTWKNESIFLDAESLRSRHKILRLALTLAAWDDKAYPNITHIHEASLYRPERLGF